MLGPIFNSAIADWDTHLDNLCGFRSSVTLMTGRYKGTPMQVHAAFPGISAELFDHWLALFRDTAERVCPPKAAALRRSLGITDDQDNGILRSMINMIVWGIIALALALMIVEI